MKIQITAVFFLIALAHAKLLIHSPKRLVDLFPAPHVSAALDKNSTVEKSKEIPDEGLMEDINNSPGFINASYSNFGFIPYGHSMVGRLYYDKKLDTMCEPIPEQDFNFNDNTHHRRRQITTPFMIADRGNCSFVAKVRHMEDAGVAVAIIIDNTEESVDSIIMSDDGNGAGIRIPGLLISKSDGDKLLNFLKTASDRELQQISMVVEFDIKRPDNRVEYDIWYSSSNDVALDFINDFSQIDDRFGDSVLMTPRFVFWVCEDCDDEFLESHCFGGGKYCATEYDNSDIPGTDIVLEDLRQMCLYKWAYGDADNADLKLMWWEYIHIIHSECDGIVNEDCSRNAMERIDASWDEINECVKNSFDAPVEDWKLHTTNNSMIDNDIKYWSKYGSSLFPAIVINNQTFRGQIETQSVMNAICAGFEDPPRVCKRLLKTKDIEHKIGLNFIKFDTGYRIHHVVGMFALAIIMLFVVLCCYRRHAKRQMRTVMKVQIEQAVNHYVQLDQSDTQEAKKVKEEF